MNDKSESETKTIFANSAESVNTESQSPDSHTSSLPHAITPTSPPSSLPCVILAGGKIKPELAAAIGTSCRALAVVRGRTLIRHVVDALLEGDSNCEITVIGDIPESPDYSLISDSGEFVSNVLAGANVYRDREFLLFATADLPFLTGNSVREMRDKSHKLAVDSGAQVIFPVVPVASCYTRFPGIKRTAVKLKEGEFTGGNLMLIRPAFLLGQEANLKQLFAARKSPLKLAGMLGAPTLAQLILSRLLPSAKLTLPFLEAAASRMIGGMARAIILDLPEIATDLDRPSDFEAVQTMNI